MKTSGPMVCCQLFSSFILLRFKCALVPPSSFILHPSAFSLALSIRLNPRRLDNRRPARELGFHKVAEFFRRGGCGFRTLRY